ncbi:uncharacterized protein SCHCODRAFT_02612494 [Schizophyllum commune H4-8]|nr:uncharacterized protein SCHCODRAFT_02612494 [Schizophyllum commune H4-8]KAI5898568.1 hypothetical protein SCHCODRAFT_02612494 [Schizophyllum commune H4-8]
MAPRVPSQSLASALSFTYCGASHSRQCRRAFSFVRNQWLEAPSRGSLRHARRYPTNRRYLHATSPLGAPKDPYKILGVDSKASAADIKKAYFALARKFHPDTNKDKSAQEKFVEIQEAYDTLKDEKKRAAYDQFGSASQQPGFDPNMFSQGGGGFGGFGGFHDFAQAFGAQAGARGGGSLFEELFSSFGGAGAGRRANMRGEDLTSSITISFLESCKGTRRNVSVQPIVDCASCSGSGLKAGMKKTTCSACSGTGQRTFVIDSGFQMATTCNVCKGAGSTIPRNGECNSCGGVGKVRIKKTVVVDIPRGVEDGMTVRVPGAGDSPISGKGPTGDLLVRIKVAPSKVFTRQGVNLYHEAKVPMHVALLGGKVRIPTLEGDVDVRVPSCTQQGEEMVLKGRGVAPTFTGETGSLFVKFSVQLPRSLTQRQRELIQLYADDIEGRTRSSSSTASDDRTTDNGPKDAQDTKSNEPPADDEAEKKRATG